MTKFSILISLLLIAFNLDLKSQNQTDTLNSKYYVSPDLFKNDSLLTVSIIMDLKTIRNDIYDNIEYHKAAFIYSLGGEKEKHLSIKIKARGHFRRSKANCDFPPLKLKFSRKEREYTVFHNYKKLKLVTHCRTRSEKYQQALFQEYLAYRVFNLLTENSFKVKLAKINYIDSRAKEASISKYAFFY